MVVPQMSFGNTKYMLPYPFYSIEVLNGQRDIDGMVRCYSAIGL